MRGFFFSSLLKKKFLSGSVYQLPILSIYGHGITWKKNPFEYLVRFQLRPTVNILGRIEQSYGAKRNSQRGAKDSIPPKSRAIPKDNQ